jgi:glutamyl-tRNA reductase
MTILAFGLNHDTAPVVLRERVAFAPEAVADHLHHALRELGLAEVAILSTCNRTEIYAAGDASFEVLRDWLAAVHGVEREELAVSCYVRCDDEAVRHMMRVASGLDSLVLGEPQILGQMKSAYVVARGAGAVSTALEPVFQAVFAAAKRVRAETAIGANPVSVAYAAVGLARQIFGRLDTVRILLIGAGDTIELVARHLHDAEVAGITCANRTLDRAA